MAPARCVMIGSDAEAKANATKGEQRILTQIVQCLTREASLRI